MDQDTSQAGQGSASPESAGQQQYYAAAGGQPAGGQPTGGQPTGGQQAYYVPVSAPVQYAPGPAPVATELTGGVKAAWFFIGFLLGIPGILIAFATNWSKPQPIKSGAIKFSAIGMAVNIALMIIFAILSVVFTTFIISSLVNSIGNFGGSYYGW
ncbi:MAG: hypothetical protein FWF30_03425 [Coriobacteriia bacterium]|nr:hypothetical protein [Coriobacteriia bacterium]